MRKGYTQFTRKDFEEFPVWELQHSLTTTEPYKGEIPFKADKFRAFFVRTNFFLADKTKLTGWTMICVPPYQVDSMSPTLLTDQGRVDLTKLAKRPTQKDIDEAFRRIGKPAGEIFPLRFETDVPVPDGPATGEMKGFLHQINYEDDNGWPQHVDCFYQTASELESAVKSFNDKEAARKAALEPSKEEKALLKAVQAQDMVKVKLLLTKGVNFNRGGTFDYEGYTRKNVTPLMLAAEVGNLELLEILLKAGAKIDLADDSNEPLKSGRTALAYAYEKHSKATRLLLEAGANPNHRLSFGHTLFDEICFEGKIEMIQLLLDFGANPNASCGKSDFFALERAVSAGRLDVVELLLKNKADINGSDTFQRTALYRIVSNASRLDPQYNANAKRFPIAMRLVKALIEKGADVNAKTKNGDSPLSLAKNCKFPDLAAYLNSKCTH